MHVTPMNPATEFQPDVSESGAPSQLTSSIWQKWSVAVGEKEKMSFDFFSNAHFHNASRVMYEALVKKDLQAQKPRDLWVKFRQDASSNYVLQDKLGCKQNEIKKNPLLGYCTRKAIPTYPVFEFAVSQNYLSSEQANQILRFGGLQLEQESAEMDAGAVASSENVQPSYFADPGSTIAWQTLGEKLKDGSHEFYNSTFFKETATQLNQSIPNDVMRDFNIWFLNTRKKSEEIKLGAGEIEKLDSMSKLIERFARGRKHFTVILELLDKAGLLPEKILEKCKEIIAS